jgi:hypothetical protein
MARAEEWLNISMDLTGIPSSLTNDLFQAKVLRVMPTSMDDKGEKLHIGRWADLLTLLGSLQGITFFTDSLQVSVVTAIRNHQQ